MTCSYNENNRLEFSETRSRESRWRPWKIFTWEMKMIQTNVVTGAMERSEQIWDIFRMQSRKDLVIDWLLGDLQGQKSRVLLWAPKSGGSHAEEWFRKPRWVISPVGMDSYDLFKCQCNCVYQFCNQESGLCLKNRFRKKHSLGNFQLYKSMQCVRRGPKRKPWRLSAVKILRIRACWLN